ncbi:MAG: uroporphyrinogen-III C-methyltransferase [Planctomycetota bacterium]
MKKKKREPGVVHLVGAGPGDPELITLRGRRRLEQADVVLHDYLASDELLAFAPLSADRVCMGEPGRGKTWPQTEINQRIVAEALAGKTVVRLKGGDPSVFGRLAEEIAACRAAGLRFEIVPGVSTAVAAGAYAGVTITDRDRASAVTFVTGHEQPGKSGEVTLDFKALAGTPGTLVVYMAAAKAARWSEALLDAGKPSDTPVAIVRRCSLPDQTSTLTTLGEVGVLAASGDLRPPLIAVIGDVSAPDGVADWFTGRPLFGRTVVVTRPLDQAKGMADRLRDAGARVLLQPTIEIGPPDTWRQVDDAIDQLSDYHTVVFSSRNGVSWFFRRLKSRGFDARCFGRANLAAIGPATAEALAFWRLRPDIMPDEYRAEALVEELRHEVNGERVLLVRASRGREVLRDQLAEAGATVDQVVVYHSHDLQSADPEVLEEIAAGRVDWITATSSAIARSAVRLFGDSLAVAKQSGNTPRFAAISPLTAGALSDCGWPAAAVAERYTADGVVDALLQAEPC